MKLVYRPHFEDWNDSINDSRFVIHQSLTNTSVQIVRLSKLAPSPDEDLQCAVETSRSISKWQSWDNPQWLISFMTWFYVLAFQLISPSFVLTELGLLWTGTVYQVRLQRTIVTEKACFLTPNFVWWYCVSPRGLFEQWNVSKFELENREAWQNTLENPKISLRITGTKPLLKKLK